MTMTKNSWGASASVVFMMMMFVSTVIAQKCSLDFVKDESWMSYTLTHPLHTFDAVSKDVQYTVVLDSACRQVTGVTGTVDVTTFDSKNSNRDSHAMEVVDAITYPDASFASTRVVQDGENLAVTGNLTFHGVTKEVLAAGTAKWADGKLTVNEKFAFCMTTFGIEKPSLLLMPVNDTLHFALQAVFKTH
jgi:polyisoprenoid-binding protein YceI